MGFGFATAPEVEGLRKPWYSLGGGVAWVGARVGEPRTGSGGQGAVGCVGSERSGQTVTLEGGPPGGCRVWRAAGDGYEVSNWT